MNKQTRTMVVAGALALLVAFFYQSSGPVKPPPVKDLLSGLDTSPAGQVVLAKLDLKAFSDPIDKKHVEEVAFPAGLVPASAALTTSDVLQKIPVEDIYQGEIISLTRVSDPDQQRERGLAEMLEPNQRAVTIEVDWLAAAGGFIQQGDIVDLVATFPKTSGGNQFLKIVIQNVKLLVVGRTLETQLRKNASGAVSGAQGNQRITIGVDAALAYKIKHLSERVRIQMILKNPRDSDVVETKGAYFQKLIEENLPAYFAPKLRTARKVIPIEVIKKVSTSTQNVVVSVAVEEGGGE